MTKKTNVDSKIHLSGSKVESRSLIELARSFENTLKHDYDTCVSCGGNVVWDRGMVLTSNPPQYRGGCQDCKESTTEFCYKVDGDLSGLAHHLNMKREFELRKCNV